ncbi:hypothetical protein Vretifemale_1523 [Volvox reticuliferus]|nr:hypothetical protein Vretifemale_1523 [Volvox reticuliferus]
MGNLVNSFTPPPGTSLSALSGSVHPLKRLFRFDPEALQAFEMAMVTETEFRRIVKVPKRIKQPQNGTAGAGQVSPGRAASRGRACAQRERPGGSRLVRQASGLDSFGPGPGARLGSGRGPQGKGQDTAASGANGPISAIRSRKSGLVSREGSVTRVSPGSMRTGLGASSRRGGMITGGITSASRRSSLLMAHAGAGPTAGGTRGMTAGAATATATASSSTRRSVRRCTSVMNLGFRAGLTNSGSPRPGSTVTSRAPSFLGLTGAGLGGQRQETRMLKPPTASAIGPAAAVMVQPVCLSGLKEGLGPSESVATAAVEARPSGAVTWTAGLPLLEVKAGRVDTMPTVAREGPFTEQTTGPSSTEALSDLPTGIMLSGTHRHEGPDSGGQCESASGRSSAGCSITKGPQFSRTSRLLAAASAEPVSVSGSVADGTVAVPVTSPRFSQGSLLQLRLLDQEHLTGTAAEADGMVGGASLANGVTGSAISQRSRSLAQLSIDSDPSSLRQLIRSARSFAHGNSPGRSSTQPQTNAATEYCKSVDSGTSLVLGLGLGLGAGNEESVTERASLVSSRSSRLGRHGSFIMLGGGGSSIGRGALAASASAAFRRSASADPAGLVASGCSSRKGTGTGMLNTSSGNSSMTASPRTSARVRGLYRSRSVDHPHVKVYARSETHSQEPASPSRTAPTVVSLVEVMPTFMDANGLEVEEAHHPDSAARQYCSGSSTRAQVGLTPALRSPGGLRVCVSGAGREVPATGSPPGLGPAGPLLACVTGMVGTSPSGSSPGFRNSCNLLSSIQEEAIENRGSKEDDAGAVELGAGISRMTLVPEANWSAGSGVRHRAGSSSDAGGMLLEYAELEASVEQQAEAVSGFNLPSFVLTHLSSNGGGVERPTSSHNVPLPSLNLGIASGTIEAEEFSYTSGGGAGSYTSGGGGGFSSGVFRGFGAPLADSYQLSASMLTQRLQAPRPTHFQAGGPPSASSMQDHRTTVASAAEGSAITNALGVGAMSATAGTVAQNGCGRYSHKHQPQPLEIPDPNLCSVPSLPSTPASGAAGRTELGLSNDVPAGRSSNGSLALPSAAPGGCSPTAVNVTSLRPAGSQALSPLAAAAVGDTVAPDTTGITSSQFAYVISPSPRSGITSGSQLGGNGVDAALREAGMDVSANGRQGHVPGGGGGGGGACTGTAASGDVGSGRHGTVVSDFRLSSEGFEDVSSLQSAGPGRGATFSTLDDVEHYMLSPSPSGKGTAFPEQRDGGAGAATTGAASGTRDHIPLHRTWTSGDKLPSVGVGGSNAITTAVYSSFVAECAMPEVAVSGLSHAAAADGRGQGGGCSGGVPTVTGTASGMMTLTSTGMATRAPQLRRRNTKDRLMSLLTSLSRDESDDEEPGDEHEWHDVYACVRLEPASGRSVAVITQTEVTEQVEVQRKLEALLEHEHKVLESIFPRHVIEHMTLQAKHRGATGAGGVGAVAVGSSWANFRGSAMEALATSHSCVTILFCDIIGFTEMCKEVSAMVVMRFLNTLYMKFDELIDIYGVYKVETIGDCYMVAGGLVRTDVEGNKSVIGDGSEDALHAVRVMSFAKAIMREAAEVVLPTGGEPVQLRVGLHSGPVMSGIVGDKMPRFCLFGDTVNTASRMESTCPPGAIHVSADTRALLQNEAWVATGGVQVKGKGLLETYVWAGHAAEEDEDAERRLKVYL